MKHCAALRLCRCAWCGAGWGSKPGVKPLSYDLKAREVVCARGYGCARRLAREERMGRRKKFAGEGRGLLPLREFLLEGFWYSVSELAALAGLPSRVVNERVAAGWAVVDCIAPRSPQVFTRAERYKREKAALRKQFGRKGRRA